MTPLNKYTVQLVNHAVAWEFYGIRLRNLGDLNQCLAERYRQLAELHEAELNKGADLLTPSMCVRLMDLLVVATQYVARAQAEGIPIPNVEIGRELVIALGPGIVLGVQGLVAAEIPTYNLPPPNYN